MPRWGRWMGPGKVMVSSHSCHSYVRFMWVKQCHFYQLWLGMVNIPPINMVMTWGWCKWYCFNHITIIYQVIQGKFYQEHPFYQVKPRCWTWLTLFNRMHPQSSTPEFSLVGWCQVEVQNFKDSLSKKDRAFTKWRGITSGSSTNKTGIEQGVHSQRNE